MNNQPTEGERRDSMASDAEDVNDFLKRIQEMGSKRDQEDEERNKKLEEEILQGRRERAARRAGLFALPVIPVPVSLSYIPCAFCLGSPNVVLQCKVLEMQWPGMISSAERDLTTHADRYSEK